MVAESKRAKEEQIPAITDLTEYSKIRNIPLSQLYSGI